MAALTQEAVLTFLLERGGQVKNSELVNHFKRQISGVDPAEKQHNRDQFKKFVNSVAVVKQVDEVKFVVVKKRYQDFVKGEMDDASFSSDKTLYSDLENNNTSNINEKYLSDDVRYVSLTQSQLGRVKPASSHMHITDNVKVLNISSDHACRPGKSGAVFAVIAVKSPPGPQRDPALLRQDGFNCEMPPPAVPVNSYCSTFEQDAWSRSHWKKTSQMEELQATGSLVRTQNKTTRQGDDGKYSESVPLEPVAHEWLVKCAAGLWEQIYGLLLQDSELARKKDFMSGFTALHWAAKGGNSEMVHEIMDISKKRGTYVNVNSKTHGGYTPLHIAAIHGHGEVMVLLVQGYGASVNVRDNDGKKPYHYLLKGASAEVRELLGGRQQDKYRDKTEDEEYREMPKGLNTISKLFQPHMGKKQKATTKIIHDW